MASEREIFGLTGPSYLTTIDWNNSHHRKSIAASLVRGAYVLERDRQQNRLGPQALAPPWWESFNFVLNQVLVDEDEHTIFGAIYEFKFQYPNPKYAGGSYPPKYVIAFRGTINKSGNRSQDFKLNLQCIINNLQNSSRFRLGMEATRNIVYKAGQGNIWLAGHSLGSSIALIIGRNMAKTGIHMETYLFNPPFISPPIEQIKNEKLKLGVRFANSVLTAGLAVAVNDGHKPKPAQDDPFIVLSSWVPYLFLNPSDPICSEYMGYFEHREYMEEIGYGKIGRLATQHSIGSIVSTTLGKDSEPMHLIPSAYLTTNLGPSKNFKEAHGIHQWWKPDLQCKYKLHQFKH
ncbi:Lipase class 3-related protein [Forsythia ovata]|uniref:Lipase class 3-related protein n=1 Tax=Forsythia ovata TaxID=205694 RepID=A0ABD1X9V7_9LAMI